MLRATLKSLLSRKLRLLLSALAVVFGVMFVSGAFVLTDTLGRSFDQLFTDIYSTTQIQVTKTSDAIGLTGQPVPANIPASAVPQVQAVDGVSRAEGQVFTDGAKVLGKNGKVVLSTGAPRFGAGWVGANDLVVLRDGRGPTADNEIAISANLAKTTGYKVGDTVTVVTTLQPSKVTYALVGITGYEGGRDSLAGETTVFFTEPIAQKLMLGETGVYNIIDVKVASGQDKAIVRDRIAAALGSGYNVKTSEQLASDNATNTKNALKFFNYILLGFAGIALFVGTFLILNTFSIIVAQRTRELALMRAIGAGRGQVIGSVLIEAIVVGTVASVLGLLAGIGVGGALGGVMGSALSGGSLHLAGLGVPLSAIVAAFGVGIGITVVAALLPALRASRIPPVAAMRDSAIADRPLTGLTIAGAAVFAIGGTVLGLSLAGKLGDANLAGLLGGILVSLTGIALLTPLISRPTVAAIGKLLSWNSAAKLGRSNSARNPRRTAITAAALMVSIAIVTAVSVIFATIKASTVEAIDTGVHADLVIAADPLSGGLGAVDPAALAEVRQLSTVDSVVGTYLDLAKVNGQQTAVGAIDDIAAAQTMFELTATAGSVATLAPSTLIVDDKTAKAFSLTAGSTVDIQLARSPVHTYTVAGIYPASAVTGGFLLNDSDAKAGFASPVPYQAYVSLKSGTDVNAALDQVNTILADSPEVSVAKVDDFVASQTQIFDLVLIFVQLLLGLAMLIAVLGIINTLALSMTERTRELGLLRAVGMKRGQVMWMVTVESIVISVFGAVLGVAVGIGLGAAVYQAMRDQGITVFALEWRLLVVYIVASVFVGLIAGFIPAVRAARLDVLKAIAYE